MLDHLDERDRRGLAPRRGFSSLFNYNTIESICKFYMVYALRQYPVIAFATPWWYPIMLDRFGLAPGHARSRSS